MLSCVYSLSYDLIEHLLSAEPQVRHQGRERTVRLRWHGFKDKTFYIERLIFFFPVAQEWGDVRAKYFNHSLKTAPSPRKPQGQLSIFRMWVGSCLSLISSTSSSWQAQSQGESQVSVGSQSDLRAQCSDISVILIPIPVLSWLKPFTLYPETSMRDHRKRSAHTQESRTKLCVGSQGTEGSWGLLDG